MKKNTGSKKYNIEFTYESIQELNKIYDYIANDLSAENSAQKLVTIIKQVINDLAYMPRRHSALIKYIGANRYYRRIVIKNYIILYSIEEEENKIYISHIYYGRTNYLN